MHVKHPALQLTLTVVLLGN